MLDGKITYEAVAEAHDLEYTPLESVSGRWRGLGLTCAGLRLRAVGEILTTSHVTPAASAITPTMKSGNPEKSRTSSPRP